MKVKRTIFNMLTTLLLCFITLSSIAQTKKYNVIYTNSDVDSLPKYSTYTRDVYNFISDNFHVNSLMSKEVGNVSQCVLVDFMIDSIGNISDVEFGNVNNFNFSKYTDMKCLQTRSRYVEKEIARIFEKMPQWQPAYKNGRFVSVRVYMPIHYIIYNRMFTITNKEEELLVKNNPKTLPLKLTIVGIVVFFFLYLFTK